MSGIIGHSMYAVLGAKAAAQRKLPVAPIAMRHFASYLAGAYLGSDIQTMPEAICVDTGREVGYGTVPLEKSPITGGAVRPWKLKHDGREYTPREIHELFYGRAHLVFGWSKADREHAVPWDHLPDYFADVVEDTFELFGPSERTLAYVFGWIVHVVSDSLIKSIHEGIDLHLLDGKYTPRNRPIQDLVTFHEIGVMELRLDWPALLADLAATPVEPVQLHYMRIAESRGRLARKFPNGWEPAKQSLLNAVLGENRRWVRFHSQDVLENMQLVRGTDGRLDCNDSIRKAVGLNYAQMLALADKANFRHALWQMGEAIAQMFEATVQRSPRLGKLPPGDELNWNELTRRWRR
ncbi:MAG TPA: hypothetical protein VI454_20165 [Verrucomicrobiae bacterium]|jgi:hypothetical protein